MSLNIQVITDHHYRIDSRLQLPYQLSTSVHHSHSHCFSILFSPLSSLSTAAARGVFIPLSRTCTCAAARAG